MATVKLCKKSAKKMAATNAKAVVGNFLIFDNEDSTVTVTGADAAGNAVDIAAVAKIAVTSGDPAVVSVDPPTGMTFVLHALKPTVAGSPAVITIVATWNDGSVGPFTASLPLDITGTVATGLIVTPGTPTVR